METKNLPSGAILEMTMASFGDGHKLLKAVSREMESVKFSLQDADGIKNLIMRLIYSDQVEMALRPCFERCMYNKRKINNELFEDEGVRADYLPVVKEVLTYNLSPFFKNLNSLLKNTTVEGLGQGLK